MALMRDYVQTYLHKSASTEDFMQIVNKHMKPGMDTEGTHRMDWFFPRLDLRKRSPQIPF